MNSKRNAAVVRAACYISNVSMAAVISLSPLLFLTFREQYGISYTLLGLMVLVNFCTQLCVDLIFSFFSSRFNLQKTVRLMPLLTVLGLLVYAGLPALFPTHAYGFLLLGTVIFSASAGLAEVLISPVIAALPSENPEREMSRAHSVYAWGVVGVVLVSTLFLQLFGRQNWYVLAVLWALVPLAAFILFASSQLPPMQTQEEDGGAGRPRRLFSPVLLLCVACIFLGGAAENTMSQWCSGYLEGALGIPKVWGDIFGVALFALMLGLGRTLYARFGRQISRFLLLGFVGASVCYLTGALSQNAIVGLAACALTGFCVSMLWPGTLIYAAEVLPHAGVAVYALLAAGGDLGSSVAPQLVGSITDAVAASPHLQELLGAGATAEQLGFQVGMLTAALFPLLGILVAILMRRIQRRKRNPHLSQGRAGVG